jgi:Kef-type K+ transport system membrane component KefB
VAILAVAAGALLAGLLAAPVQGALMPGPLESASAPAAGADGQTTRTLISLIVLLVGAKVGEEVLRRLGQPGVVGELLGGFIVGPFGLGLVTPGSTELVFAELGVIVLLFSVGLEVRTDDLFAVGRPSVLTATIAMALPIAAGFALATLIGQPPTASLFVGLALAATSIGITSRVLRDMGVLGRTFGRVIIGAALVDDILALVLIGLATGVADGNLSANTLLVGVAGIGLVLLGFLAARRARGVSAAAFTWPHFAETPFLPAFLMMLAIAVVAASIGLAAIIGAFVAGLIVAETGARREVQHEVRPLAAIFTPFFFAVTGAQLDLSALRDPAVVGLAVTLALFGVVTKAIGGIIGALSIGRWGSVAVGFGMVPRGEVGIVVANLALVSGAIDSALFATLMVAVVLTTLVAPYLLHWAVPRAEREEAARASPTAA